MNNLSSLRALKVINGMNTAELRRCLNAALTNPTLASVRPALERALQARLGAINPNQQKAA